MSRVLSIALLLVIALAALPAAAAPAIEPAAPQAAAPGAQNPEFMGMVIRDPYYDFDTNPAFPGQPNYAAQDRMGQILAAAGVRWVRLDFLADDDGHVNFAKYDYFIGTVAPRYGFKVLGLLGTATIPTWVVRDGQGVYYPILLNYELDNKTDDRYGAALNQYMIDWLTEALRVAEHYDGSNLQAGRVHAFEIFNEVNRLFGDGTNLDSRLDYAGMDPARVARMQAKFYRICKNTDGSQPITRCPPDTQIIVGGIHPKGTSNRRSASQKETFKYTDQQYLQAMYDSAFKDFKNYQQNKPEWRGTWPVDGVAYHPYPQEIRLSVNDAYVDRGLNRMRATIDANDPGKLFWITEVGYNVGFKINGVVQTEMGQAAFMQDVYTSLYARPQHDVANVFWFKYEDFPPASGSNAQRWGIVRIPFADGPCPGGACYEAEGWPEATRPAFFTYRALAGLPIAQTFAPVAAR
jgi:hypothetical protein